MAKSKLSSRGARGASPLLKEGSTGPAVVRLQTKLKKVGFNPGRADGDFGPATTAALIGFQKSAGLLADGIAGPRTLAALKLAATDRLPSVIPGVTVTIVSKMFPFTQGQHSRQPAVCLEGLGRAHAGRQADGPDGTGDHSCRDRKLPAYR